MLLFGIISPDQTLCHALSEQLREEETWQMALFSSLEDALGVWGQNLPPLLFWDSQKAPATTDMVEYFHHCLSQARPSPLLFVLGEVPEALESFGVNEHFSRPLRLGYMLSRLQISARALAHAPAASRKLGPWLFAPRNRTLINEATEKEEKLTEKETALLEFLSSSKTPSSKEELLSLVWGYEDGVTTHTLETHIYRLRKKLQEGQESWGDPVLSEEGGYLFNPKWHVTD